MVAPTHARLSIVRQYHLVSIARSSFYYEGQGESPVNLRLLRVIDEQFLETPFYGSRQMTRWLRRPGDTVSRKRVRRLMRRLGVHAVCQRPRTSQSHPGHRIYPYLLRDLHITQPNHVWCTDVTYIPLQRGFLYLVAVMDWASRTVLSWRLSNTLEANFCVEALHEALERYGPPAIFNSDQGSQFTSVEFTDVLKEAGIRIPMDGQGPLDGQRVYRAAVAIAQVRVRLPGRVRNRFPGPDRNRLVDGLLQPAPAPLVAQRPDARRSVH